MHAQEFVFHSRVFVCVCVFVFVFAFAYFYCHVTKAKFPKASRNILILTWLVVFPNEHDFSDYKYLSCIISDLQHFFRVLDSQRDQFGKQCRVFAEESKLARLVSGICDCWLIHQTKYNSSQKSNSWRRKA